MKSFQRVILLLFLMAPVLVGLMIILARFGSGASGGVGFRKIGQVRIEGAIFESENIVKQLQQFMDDNLVAGVLLRIDSPGGATAPSQEIYQAVARFRKCGKPLVASMGNVAASGGYYVACAAQRIFADAGTLTGSIGVIMTVPLYKDLAKKIGIEMRTFKSGDFKDLANPYRPMSDPERRMIQELLDDTHLQFVDDVATARDLPLDSLLPLADGRIFTGRQALLKKLVDTLGTREDALSYLRSITGVGQNARVIDGKETSEKVREWFVREMVRFAPQLYQFISPWGMHCLTVFE